MTDSRLTAEGKPMTDDEFKNVLTKMCEDWNAEIEEKSELPKKIRAYGDRRTAEARKAALEECLKIASKHIPGHLLEPNPYIHTIMDEIRQLAGGEKGNIGLLDKLKRISRLAMDLDHCGGCKGFMVDEECFCGLKELRQLAGGEGRAQSEGKGPRPTRGR